jgi:hypothetical protein
VAPIGIGPTSPSQDFPVVPPPMAKRDELVWLCMKVSFDKNKCAGSQTKYTIEY